VQLADAEFPIEVIGAALSGADGWLLQVIDGDGYRFVRLEEADVNAARIVDPDTDDDRRLTVADLAELPDLEDFGRSGSTTGDGPAPVAQPSSAAGDDSRSNRRNGPWSVPKLAAVLLVSALLVGGGFAAGWYVDKATTTSDGPADSAVPLADLFDASPGALDGRVAPGRQGATWTDPSASFVVDDGVVRVVPESDLPAIAIIEQSGRVTSVRAAFSTVAATAGMVFRYQDAGNYWQVTAAPSFGTWEISRVEDGEATAVADLGFRGGTTIDVIFVGSSIQFLVDGVLGEIIRDEFLDDSDLVGLIVGSTGGDVVVDEFYANAI